VNYVVVAFTKFAKESEKTIVTLWILSRRTKNLFLTAEPGGYHFILACQGCFKCTKLHIRTSVHRQDNCCSETFFSKFSERTLFKTLRHLQSF